MIVQHVTETEATNPIRPSGESLYRTQWLMAHNALHTLAHAGGSPQAAFEDYMRELKTAEAVALRPA